MHRDKLERNQRRAALAAFDKLRKTKHPGASLEALIERAGIAADALQAGGRDDSRGELALALSRAQHCNGAAAFARSLVDVVRAMTRARVPLRSLGDRTMPMVATRMIAIARKGGARRLAQIAEIMDRVHDILNYKDSWGEEALITELEWHGYFRLRFWSDLADMWDMHRRDGVFLPFGCIVDRRLARRQAAKRLTRWLDAGPEFYGVLSTEDADILVRAFGDRPCNPFEDVFYEGMGAVRKVSERVARLAADPYCDFPDWPIPLPYVPLTSEEADAHVAESRARRNTAGSPTQQEPRMARRRYRGATPQGWVYLADAAREHGIPIPTIHRYANKLDAACRRKDPESGTVMVDRDALESLLSRKQRIAARSDVK